MVLVWKAPSEMWLAISLGAAWTVEAELELCLPCVLMEVKNGFHYVHNCFANFHTEVMNLLWFFYVFYNCNAELQISHVNDQLHWEGAIRMEQDVVAIMYISVRLP